MIMMSVQVSAVVGTPKMPMGETYNKQLGAFEKSVDQKKRKLGAQETKVNASHDSLKKKQRAGTSKPGGAVALDNSVGSLNTRFTAIRKQKLYTESDGSSLNTFEVATLLLHKGQAANQRMLNEVHVQELMVRICSFIFIISR
jgi:hypothetical protein